MQDNCSIHNSKKLKQWFCEHQTLQVLQKWLPNSPDLNPIENFWAEITRNWESVFPRNRTTLNQYILQNWESFRGNTQYFENLYKSIPQRIQEVINRNGGATSY